MRITIDTKADSKEEIKKVVQLLLALSKEGEGNEIRENSGFFSVDKKEEATNAFVNIFEDNNSERSSTAKKEPDIGTPIDFSGFTNLIGNSEKTIKKEEPKLIFL